ncbi:hypothetical protein QTP86_027252, partial [Hemibagrus guttatus]
IKQFGAIRREHEDKGWDVPYKPGMGLDTLGADVDKRTQEVEREPPEKPRVAFQSAILEPLWGTRERYKESLKQQMEEKRRMEAERRERLKLEEEKRLAVRGRTEKESRKEKEQNARNQELIRQAEERRGEAEKKRKVEEEKANEALKQQYEQEKQARLEQVQSISTPQSPPVPARRNQIRATEERQDVIRKLSFMRQHLRSEQKRLERQLQQSDREDTQTLLKSRHRMQPLLNAFDLARLRMQMAVTRPPSNTRALNNQIIQDFNQLKYRDYFGLSSPMKPAPRRRDGYVEEAGRSPLSARERRRRASRTDYSDDGETPSGERNIYSLGSANSFQLDRVRELNQRRMIQLPLNYSNYPCSPGEISADEGDDLWQKTPSPPPARRVSTTTGATEMLKKLKACRRPSSCSLPRDEQDALSTYHG